MWKGTFTLYNNEDFLKVFEKTKEIEVIKVMNDFANISKKKIIGNLNAYYYYPTSKITNLIYNSKKLNCANIYIITNKKIKELNKNEEKKESSGTYIVNLNKNSKEILKNMEKRCRYAINKAIKDELIYFKKFEDEKEFDEFYELYIKNCNINKIPFENKNSISNLLKSEFCELFLIKLKDTNEIIAGACVLIDKENKTLEYKWSALSYEHKNLNQNNYLHWNIINWGKDHEFSKYDLGGVTINENKKDKYYSLYLFKRAFGGEFSPIYRYKIVSNRIKNFILNILKLILFTKKKILFF